MEIRYVSDLHLEMLAFNNHEYTLQEFLNLVLPITEKDKERALVLAGDLVRVDSFSTQDVAKQFFQYCSLNFKYVVYVPGNHEYYGMSIENANNILMHLAEAYDNVYCLDRTLYLPLGKEIFVGGVLWSDVLRYGPVVGETIRCGLSDYFYIKDFYLTDCVEQHKAYIEKFEGVSAMDIPDDHNLIIVTHHLPSYNSIPKQYKDSPYNPAFATKLDYLVKKLSPKVWIHGHTHSSCSYKIGDTQVVANPFGYDFRENPEFLKEAVINLNSN